MTPIELMYVTVDRVSLRQVVHESHDPKYVRADPHLNAIGINDRVNRMVLIMHEDGFMDTHYPNREGDRLSGWNKGQDRSPGYLASVMEQAFQNSPWYGFKEPSAIVHPDSEGLFLEVVKELGLTPVRHEVPEPVTKPRYVFPNVGKLIVKNLVERFA